MFKRPILRNEEGASPGGGAAQPVETPAEPQAQGDAPVTMSALKGLLAGLSGEIAAQVKNGVHADLRRAGVYDKPKDPPPAAPVAKTTEPSTATASDPKAEFQQILTRQRAFDRVAASAGLSDRQLARMEESFQALNPPDPAEWARGYLEDLGLGKANTPVQPVSIQATPVVASPVVPPKPTTNISDRGPATAGDVRDEETFVRTRPLEMTSSDFERLQLKVGREKALQIVQESTNAKLRTIRMTPDRRR